MSNQLASDMDNRDFTGAMNPDERLSVQFYLKPVRNNFKSDQQGRPIFEDVDFIKIFVPGDPTSIVDTPARQDHKDRFPRHWAAYQSRHGGDQKEIGTPLSMWPRLTPSQVEELKALKFYTVEAIAGASDSNLQRLGMIAGMSPFAFRDMANRYLRVSENDAAVKSADEQVKATEEKFKALFEENERLKAQINMIANKGGRPPKER